MPDKKSKAKPAPKADPPKPAEGEGIMKLKEAALQRPKRRPKK